MILLNCGVGEDLRVPWTAKRSNQSILKEVSPECSLEGLMLKLKLQYFLMRRPDSFEKTLMQFFSSGGQHYWRFSFNISPSDEYSGLISFRMDWLDLFAVQGTLKKSSTPQFKSINSSALSLLYGPTLTSIHGYWKNHSFDYTDLCGQSDISAF